MTDPTPTASLGSLVRSRLLQALPRVLALLDKNPLSTTYGCLDRKYWQYKIIDFPSGMQQELARVLAWTSLDQGQDNPWRGCQRLREYALAAITFFARTLHPDGSLDDYFPWERALGATAYATAAVTDACLRLGWTPDAKVREALSRAGGFLIRHREAGLLANHHAIAASALLGIAATTGESSFAEQARRRIENLAAMQHPEGWFPEYQGCDIGYQTVTLEFLARCEALRPGLVPGDMLDRLIGFLHAFAHPDGSLGGEYGSRNTYNFYPGGFALRSATSDGAAAVLGLYRRGLLAGTDNRLEDDGVFGHMLSSSVTVLTAADMRVLETPPPQAVPPTIRVYEGCGLYTAATGDLRLFGSLTKGGSFKLFRGLRLALSDTGFAGTLGTGAAFCQNNPDSASATVTDQSIAIRGTMRPYRNKRLTQASMLALRLLCFVFGRFSWFSPAIRRLMQAMLIYHKKTIPVAFQRDILLDATGITVRDAVRATAGATLTALWRTPDCVNIHVVTSDSMQQANLLSWESCAVGNDGSFQDIRHIPRD